MQIAQNTILVTGGGSGIGRGLAESFHHLGNQVIIAGRRREQLERVAAVPERAASLQESEADERERNSARTKSHRLASEIEERAATETPP